MVHTYVAVGGVRGACASPRTPFHLRRQTHADYARACTRYGRNNGIAEGDGL